MSGNKLGGAKAAATNRRKYGKDYYARVGALGGKVGTTGGFYANPELASRVGKIGGARGRRTFTKAQRKAHSDFMKAWYVQRKASPIDHIDFIYEVDDSPFLELPSSEHSSWFDKLKRNFK